MGVGGWVGGWLDQVRIRLTQLSTGLKVEAELGNIIGRSIGDHVVLVILQLKKNQIHRNTDQSSKLMLKNMTTPCKI